MKVQTYIDKAGEYRWRLRARNGRVIADCGEGYRNKRNLLIALKNMARSAGFTGTDLGFAFHVAWLAVRGRIKK